MPSYQIFLTRHERAAGRFIAMVRRALQQALAEEHAARGVTQSSIASALGVNRSVIHRQIMGLEDISLGRVAAIAEELGRTAAFSLTKLENAGNYKIGTQAQYATEQANSQSSLGNRNDASVSSTSKLGVVTA